MKTLKTKFTYRITAKDVEAADHFTQPCSCLVATMLQRRGHKGVIECVDYSCIDGVKYNHEFLDFTSLHVKRTARPPFYHPTVIGKKITFTRA